AVGREDRPLVAALARLAGADGDHRLDRDERAGLDRRQRIGPFAHVGRNGVGDKWRPVQPAAVAVAAKAADEMESTPLRLRRLDESLHRAGPVDPRPSGLEFLDAAAEGLLAAIHQALGERRGLAEAVGPRRVADPPLEPDADVDLQDVALAHRG